MGHVAINLNSVNPADRVQCRMHLIELMPCTVLFACVRPKVDGGNPFVFC